MATSETPSREPGPSYSLPSPQSPRQSQWTFSSQRAGFTKPVPAALLPVYPKFPGDSNPDDSDDEVSVANMLTKANATPQEQIIRSPTAGGSSQGYLDVDTMAMAEQTTLPGFAEKSGISPPLRSPSLAGFERSSSRVEDMQVKPESNSESVLLRLATFLGLQKRQERQQNRWLSSPRTEASFRPPSFSDSGSSLSANNSLFASAPEDSRDTSMSTVIEDDCGLPCDEQLQLPGQSNEPSRHRKQGKTPSYTSATYPPVQPGHRFRHRRSRSLDVCLTFPGARAPATCLHTSSQGSLIAAQEPQPRSSMDDQSRRDQTICIDGNLWHSSYYSFPVSLPHNCLLVQVCAVGLDESDRQLAVASDASILDEANRIQETIRHGWIACKGHEGTPICSGVNNSTLLKWTSEFGGKREEKESMLGWLSISSIRRLSTPDRQTPNDRRRMVREVSRPKSVSRETGHIPGQSFVGRVLEVGSGVDKSFAARDDWVVGLVDIRKCGPLAEFIIIDWRQVYRVPAPCEPCPSDHTDSGESTLVSELPYGKPTQDAPCNQDTFDIEEEKQLLRHSAPLTFDELALLPLCGIPAYRAVKTCIDAFPAKHDDFTSSCVDEPVGECPNPTRRRRALVLRGHDGAGAMAVQMLIQQGWRVSAHVPFSRVPWDATQAEADGFMSAIEVRLRKWGVDEVIYDDANSYANCDGEMDDRKAAVVRVIDTLRADGDVFDAVLDFVGGREIREVSEGLLRLPGSQESEGVGQFTTVGDTLDDQTPTVADNFRSKFASAHDPSYANQGIEALRDTQIGRKLRYAQIGGVFESGDEEVCESLDSVLRFALEDGIRPPVEEVGGEIFGRRRAVSLEEAPDVLVDGDLLSDGGLAILRVAT